MKRNISIQLKAALLIIIFGFNTVVGFACAIGIDLGYNTYHHMDEEAMEMSHHSDVEDHHHEKKEHKHPKNGPEDDCCKDIVLKIVKADKAVPQVAKLLSPVFFTAFVAVYSNINISYPSQINTFNKYYVLGHHPPIPDIRIAIQSFQI